MTRLALEFRCFQKPPSAGERWGAATGSFLRHPPQPQHHRHGDSLPTHNRRRRRAWLMNEWICSMFTYSLTFVVLSYDETRDSCLLLAYLPTSESSLLSCTDDVCLACRVAVARRWLLILNGSSSPVIVSPHHNSYSKHDTWTETPTITYRSTGDWHDDKEEEEDQGKSGSVSSCQGYKYFEALF